ncbi:MAG: hypothetical protein ACI4AH_06455, partial [Muribaculaceae bacterium]
SAGCRRRFPKASAKLHLFCDLAKSFTKNFLPFSHLASQLPINQLFTPQKKFLILKDETAYRPRPLM